MLCATTWMNLEAIILSESCQSQKNKYRMFSLLRDTASSRTHGSRKQNDGYRGPGREGNEELPFNG